MWETEGPWTAQGSRLLETLTHGGGKESGRRNKPGASACEHVRPSRQQSIGALCRGRTDGRRKKKTLQGPIQLFLECRDASVSLA